MGEIMRLKSSVLGEKRIIITMIIIKIDIKYSQQAMMNSPADH